MNFTIFLKKINCIATVSALIFCTAILCNFASAQKPKTKKNSTPKICTGGVINSKVIFKIEPIYTEEAKKARAEGDIFVMVRVDEEGNIYEATACGGNELLRQSAVDAAYQTKIAPTKLSGQAVKVAGVLLYRFKIGEEKGRLVEIKTSPAQ